MLGLALQCAHSRRNGRQTHHRICHSRRQRHHWNQVEFGGRSARRQDIGEPGGQTMSKTWAQPASATWCSTEMPARSPHRLYIYRSHCPYCNRFGRPRVRGSTRQGTNCHLLVGIIKADSPAKAAAILGSAALREKRGEV